MWHTDSHMQLLRSDILNNSFHNHNVSGRWNFTLTRQNILCVQLLQQNLETNYYSGQVNWDDVSPNDAAALLKKFIRELPAPLLTAEYLNTFSAVRGQWAPVEHEYVLLLNTSGWSVGSQMQRQSWIRVEIFLGTRTDKISVFEAIIQRHRRNVCWIPGLMFHNTPLWLHNEWTCERARQCVAETFA